MEIKDMILSTISDLEKTLDDTKEMQKKFTTAVKSYSNASEGDLSRHDFDFSENEYGQNHEDEKSIKDEAKNIIKEIEDKTAEISIPSPKPKQAASYQSVASKESKDYAEEVEFLEALRERILVLFEGLQSPNSRELEKKVDLVLNYLEYQLSHIEERLEKIRNN